jgi:hypothetical protein
MSFHDFARAVNNRVNLLTSQRGTVFRAAVNPDDLWAAYMDAFPPGTNEVFRVNREHDCSSCRSFIRNVGALIRLDDDFNVETIWQGLGLPEDSTYGIVAKALDAAVRASGVGKVFLSDRHRHGAEKTRELLEDDSIHTWHHFWAKLPDCLVDRDAPAKVGELTTSMQLLKRGLDELTVEALEITLGLITENQLYRGAENKQRVSDFLTLKAGYDQVPEDKREAFVWRNVKSSVARFRNTSIGTLVVDLSAGAGVQEAVRKFEAMVAPQNYRRSSAVITTNMVKDAVEKLEALDLSDAVHRRFAVISDVSPADVLFVDRSVRPHMKGGLTDLLMGEVRQPSVSSKGAIDVTGDEFFESVLPGAETVQLKLERQHLGNFVSLTAPMHGDTGRLFSWDNDFAWVYDGDVTDSIKERVKRAGGNVDAALRISLAWFNADDLDFHCQTPHGEIYYGDRGQSAYTDFKPVLDVDMNGMDRHDPVAPVENLSWPRLPIDGNYTVWVRQFNRRTTTRSGFEIEWANGSDVRRFSYPKTLRQSETVSVCQFTVSCGEITKVTFDKTLTVGESAEEKWGLTTGQLVPVDTVMLSPNHWGPEEPRKGNLHRIFILRGCKNPNAARGFFNEYLRPELHQHRKVFEVLADKTKCPPSDDQLSGVGFSSTRRDRATFVVTKDGTTRTFNVQF